ncbi:MAG TPA: protoporphyrinogen oxidase [Polyangiaceae bacterium]|nr:protoporphyrinogen oxidase [Polyangiaceae bacterium]
MTEPRRIVIVGGGITGLAAAHAALLRARELRRPVTVTVLERSGRFGGNLVTERVDGFLLDGGPDSWVTSKPQASALARELGLGGALVGTNEATRRFFVAHRGVLHAVPEGLVLGVPTKLRPLVRTNLFSWPGKLRMAMEPLIPARRDASGPDESIADFARRRLGREAAELLVAPLLGGISAGDASDLSVRSAFPQLVAMEREHGSLVRGMLAVRRAREASGSGTAGSAFVSLPGGVGQLVDALVERLRALGADLRLRVPVRALARSGGGSRAAWTFEVEGGDAIPADEVLLAVPGYAAAALAAGLDDALAGQLAAFRNSSTATVFLGYRRAQVTHPLDGVGFVVPRAAGQPVLAGTWVSSKWDHRAPAGHALLRVFFGGPAAEPLLRGDDAGLVLPARAALRDLMAIDAEPVLARVFRFDRASPQMRIGHAVAVAALQARLASALPGVHVAGGGYEGIGIPDCIRQGTERGRALVDASPR